MVSAQEQNKDRRCSYLMVVAKALISSDLGFIIGLAKEKGPNYVLNALKLIPPKQVSARNFEQRLAIEKRLRGRPEQKIERVIRVTGDIQGVGFREFCKKRAFTWGITSGFARNEPDDSVTILVQGYPSILDTFLEEDDFKGHAVEKWIGVSEIKILEDREIKKPYPRFYVLREGQEPK